MQEDWKREAKLKERSRINQRKYRCQKKLSLEEVDKRVKELQHSSYIQAIYLALVAQRTYLRHSRYCDYRAMTLGVYSDYFRYGADPEDAIWFEKQRTFLSFIFSKDFSIGLPGAPKGYEPLLEQAHLFTALHDQFEVKRVSINCVDQVRGDIFTLVQTAHLTICHRTIASLYPHMLQDTSFMEKAMGKVLTYQFTLLITFDSDHEIIAMQVEQPLATAWLVLLKDPVLTAKVLEHKKIDPTCYIERQVSL